jgi:DASS family divalent anion:Na+ symporter
MPSTAARGGGIIYPIASALAKVYENPAENDFKQNKMGAYLMQLCLQGNVITGAIFLTAMVGNALIFGTAKTMGYNYSWFDWAIAAIVPGCINLLLLPFIIAYLLPSSSTDHTTIPALAKMELRKMGKLHIKEILVILNFGLLIILWMLGDKLGIDATAAAFVGFALFLLSGVLKEKTAWETLMWFGTLIMLSDCLNQFQIMNWATTEMELIVSGQHNFVALIILALVYFYSHYFFASVTIHMTALFSSFFILFIKLGVPPFVAAMSLAMFSNLSGGLTHYTTTPAPLYFSSNYMTVSKWCRVGIIVSIVNLSIWLVIAPLWWKLLGWW